MEEGKRFVQGEDIVITLSDDTMLHATNHDFQSDLELKDVRTKHTNGKEKSPGDLSWSVNADGLVVVNETIEDTVDAEGLLEMHLNKTLVEVSLKAALTGSLAKVYTGKAYITSYKLSTPAGDNVSYSVTLTGSGNLTPTNPSSQQSDDSQTDNSQTDDSQTDNA